MGVTDWRIAYSVLCGFIAKEKRRGDDSDADTRFHLGLGRSNFALHVYAALPCVHFGGFRIGQRNGS